MGQFWTTLIFFIFDKYFLYAPQIFFGGAKKFKNHFRSIFLLFKAILNNFDFFSFLTKKRCTPPNFYFFGGGDTPKFIFAILHLVWPIRTNERTNERTSRGGDVHTNEQKSNIRNPEGRKEGKCSALYIWHEIMQPDIWPQRM